MDNRAPAVTEPEQMSISEKKKLYTPTSKFEVRTNAKQTDSIRCEPQPCHMGSRTSKYSLITTTEVRGQYSGSKPTENTGRSWQSSKRDCLQFSVQKVQAYLVSIAASACFPCHPPASFSSSPKGWLPNFLIPLQPRRAHSPISRGQCLETVSPPKQSPTVLSA